jgi:AAA domain/Bifunctional DNA primase/polymerase, N-terminal/Primase C terminal 1 (PriCT-1)
VSAKTQQASDRRSSEFLVACARRAQQLGLALAWSDGLEGEQAKTCSRSGSAAWKAAQKLSPDAEAAAGFFAGRARTRNPAVVASASGLVLVEADGEMDAILRAHGLPDLPPTVRVRSRRGWHAYFRPPTGRDPLKVQLAPEAITVSVDGYLIGAGALHASGHIYVYEDELAWITELPLDLYDALVAAGEQTREHVFATIERGAPVPEGGRNDALFHHALQLVREARPSEEILAGLRHMNEQQCRPPLEDRLVVKALRGALVWAAKHPSEQELANAKARELYERRKRGEPLPANGVPAAARRRLQGRPLSNVEGRMVDYVIPGHVPARTLSLVAGVGGLGKSALLLAWAAAVTLAGRNVLIISYEDAAEEVLRPRFEALGGDLERLWEVYVDPEDGSVSFPDDLDELEQMAVMRQARLVLIDPVSASLDVKLDSHRDQDVRVVLGRLTKLAERQDLGVVMNAHLNKAPSNDPYLRINGSTAFYNAARSVLTVTTDPSEPERGRLVAQHKSNYGPVSTVQRWQIEVVPIATAGGVVDTARIVFVEDAEDVSRQDVLAQRGERGAEKLDEAIAFLKAALADGDWHESEGLKTIARGAVGASERTLKRALQTLDGEAERRGFPSKTWWRLDQSGQQQSGHTPYPQYRGPTGLDEA